MNLLAFSITKVQSFVINLTNSINIGRNTVKFLMKLFVAFSVLVSMALPAHAIQKVNGKFYAVVASNQDIQTLDPAQKYDYSMRIGQEALYDSLLRYVDEDPKPKPWIAKSWTVSDDATVYTFKLDERAKFHSGNPVDAEAVKASFVRTLKIGKQPSGFIANYLKPENITVKGKHTIEFKLDYPYAAFTSVLPWIFIVDTKEVMKHEKDGDMGQAYLDRNGAGSGPFILEKVDEGNFLQFGAVDNYWKGWPHKNHIGGFVFKLIRESSSQRTALIRGEADIALDISSDELPIVAKDKNVEVKLFNMITTYGIKFNTQVGKMKDINLRKAVAYSFDYDTFVKVFNGNAVLQVSPFSKGVLGHVAVDMPRKDMKKAKEYLAKSAYPNGGIELEYVYEGSGDMERQFGLVLMQGLKELNIDVKIVPLTWTAMVGRMSSVDTSPEMVSVYAGAAAADPDLSALNYDKASWGNYYGSHFLDAPELQAKIEKARTLPNWDDRAKLYAEIQQDIVDQQPEIFGMTNLEGVAFRKYIKGLNMGAIREIPEIDAYTLYIDR